MRKSANYGLRSWNRSRHLWRCFTNRCRRRATKSDSDYRKWRASLNYSVKKRYARNQ